MHSTGATTSRKHYAQCFRAAIYFSDDLARLWRSCPRCRRHLPRVASPASPISAESDKLLHRMFASTDFEVKNFGPARWLDGGDFYTTVEPSADSKDAQDIVRYETATGKREVLVSAAKLIPAGAKSPLAIEDYSWSKDKTRLLIYTNSAPVWRQNTRGDYWVLNSAVRRATETWRRRSGVFADVCEILA